MSDQRKYQEAPKRSIAEQLAPITARRAESDRAFPGQKEGNTSGEKTSAAVTGNMSPNAGCEAFETVEISCAMKRFEQPREDQHQRKKSTVPLKPDTAEG